MLLGCAFVAWLLSEGRANAQTPEPSSEPVSNPQSLKRLSIEDLAQLRVTSVGKRVERLSDVAAAVTVIRGEDIRRLGVTSLPEALRLADGMQVAQVYGPGWAISTRGFAISTSNKLLVLVDGRSVYSPLFSGVLWDVLDVLVSDIDRIEVVRGPGGALWGANAVNGVVNVITKPATETQGAIVGASVGNETRAAAAVRFGGMLAPKVAYRAYAKFRADDQHVFATGEPARDDVQFGQAGFRLDSAGGGQSNWTLQGDAYAGREGLFDRADTRVSGGNLLGRWTTRPSATSQFQAQVFYDRTNRTVERQYDASLHTLDIDLQQQMQAGQRNKLVAGAGLRLWKTDDLGSGAGFYFEPQVRTFSLANIFLSNELSVVPNRLSLIAGAKIERYGDADQQVQPSVRMRFTPGTRHTLWGAVSRAVRMPTRFDTDLRVLLPNGRLIITGDSQFKPEGVVAYEAGYRTRPADWMLLDAAVFLNRYTNLRSQEPPAAATDPFRLGNGLTARTSGIELTATVTPTTWWQVHMSYSHLGKEFSRLDSSGDASGGVNEGNDPTHTFSVRTSIDLPRRIEFDVMLRQVAQLPQPAVPGYTELHGRLGWSPNSRWSLSILGQNLLHPKHLEFAAGTPRELFERGLSVRCSLRF